MGKKIIKKMGDGGKAKPKKQEGFFPDVAPVDHMGIQQAHRTQDSTDFSQILMQNPQQAMWLYQQYQQMANSKDIVAPNAQGVLDSYNAALGAGPKRLAFGGFPSTGAPVTPEERDQYSKYTTAMYQQPGWSARNWDHNQDFQKQNAAQAGFDYSRLPAIQAEMQSRAMTAPNTMSTGPMGVSKVDGWDGSKQKDQRYVQYQYVNNTKGTTYNAGANPLSQDQANSFWGGNTDPRGSGQTNWASNNQGTVSSQPASVASQPNAWKSNDMGIGMDAPQADIDKLYAPKDATPMGSGGKIHIKKSHEGKFTEYKKRTGKTTVEALHSTDPHVRQMANFAKNAAKWHHGDGGRILMDTGGPLVTDQYPPGMQPMPNAIQGQSAIQPQMPPTGVQRPMEADNGVTQMADYSQQAPQAQARPGGSKTIGFSTAGLLSGALNGADALVTQNIYNPRIRAREAQMQRDLSRPVQAPTDFYGHDMGQYAKGGYIPAGAGDSNNAYEVDPSQANALVESKERIQLPNGSMFPVTGDEAHSDKPDGMGGKYMNLPAESRVYSKRKMIDKAVASAITDSKITKKISPSELVRKYDTSNEEDILDNKLSDPIAVRTADLMKGIKDGKKDQVFNAQEMAAGRNMPGSYAFGGTLMAGNGAEIQVPQAAFNPWAVQSGQYTAPQIGGFSMDPGPSSVADDRNIGPRQEDGSFYSQQANIQPMPASTLGPGFFDNLKQWATKDLKGTANLKDAALYAPEMLGTIHALTDHPIWSEKFQPVYNKAHQLNVQADLNRNQSLAYPVLQRAYGDAGVGRAAALATLVDSANQIGQQKANYDSQQRITTDNQNAATSNDANWKNIQMGKMMADQMAQRQFNKDKSLENITQSVEQKAYELKHSRNMEKNSLDILNKMYPNWQYNQNGLTAQANGPWFHNPYGYMGGPTSGFDPGDGVRGSETETTTINGKKYVKKWTESDRN